jgi:hypothetical protein
MVRTTLPSFWGNQLLDHTNSCNILPYTLCDTTQKETQSKKNSPLASKCQAFPPFLLRINHLILRTFAKSFPAQS